MQIRPAIPADLAAIQSLERASETAAHWSNDQYHSLFAAEPKRLILIAETAEEKSLLGFLIAQTIIEEWEIENIVVSPAMRRKGLATSLLQSAINQAEQSLARSIFLEIRASNAPACALYGKLSFQQIGSRANYYRDPQEDAVLYRLNLNR